jgi:hypothetical protein
MIGWSVTTSSASHKTGTGGACQGRCGRIRENGLANQVNVIVCIVADSFGRWLTGIISINLADSGARNAKGGTNWKARPYPTGCLRADACLCRLAQPPGNALAGSLDAYRDDRQRLCGLVSGAVCVRAEIPIFEPGLDDLIANDVRQGRLSSRRIWQNR